MNDFSRKSPLLVLLALLVLLPATGAFGQSYRVTAEEPQLIELESPQFGVSKSKDFKPKEWLELEAKIKVEMSPEPQSLTCDAITVKWYLAVANPDKARTMLLITKEVKHVNIPLGEDIYCSAYLSPASVRRILGAARNAKKVVEYVGYEVVVNGEVKAEQTNKGRPGWWSVASPKISRSEAVTLLDKTETPFSHLWWDRYAEVSTQKK